jgi:hypothetical protein
MLTIGGMFYEERERSLLNACGFQQLTFVRGGDQAFTIRAPKLTHKEIRYLNSQLPRVPATEVILSGVPESDVQAYAAIYRYYPSFIEILAG